MPQIPSAETRLIKMFVLKLIMLSVEKAYIYLFIYSWEMSFNENFFSSLILHFLFLFDTVGIVKLSIAELPLYCVCMVSCMQLIELSATIYHPLYIHRSLY